MKVQASGTYKLLLAKCKSIVAFCIVYVSSRATAELHPDPSATPMYSYTYTPSHESSDGANTAQDAPDHRKAPRKRTGRPTDRARAGWIANLSLFLRRPSCTDISLSIHFICAYLNHYLPISHITYQASSK